MGLGMIAGWLVGAEYHDATLILLATFSGISSLFLFAGLEIDVESLQRGGRHLLAHLLLRACTLAAATWVGVRYFGYPWNTALLFALAALMPSTG